MTQLLALFLSNAFMAPFQGEYTALMSLPSILEPSRTSNAHMSKLRVLPVSMAQSPGSVVYMDPHPKDIVGVVPSTLQPMYVMRVWSCRIKLAGKTTIENFGLPKNH